MSRSLVTISVLTGVLLVTGCEANGWRDKRNDSAGIAPDPATTPEAVVQVYGAPVYGWRGAVADHTWIVVKPPAADAYRIYQVIGWRLRRSGSVVSVDQGVPDRYWFGSAPALYLDVRGARAAELIPRIQAASDSYPYAGEYTMWPGPNSNSYIQWIALEVPALGLELPWRAWGKNWMIDNYASAVTAD
jgi:hypothetical protein